MTQILIFFLEIVRKLLGYRVRTQAFGTCTSYHYNSYINISFSCGFLHGGICFLFLITFIEIWRYLYFTSRLVSYICRNSDALTRSHFAKHNTLVKESFFIAHYPAEQFWKATQYNLQAAATIWKLLISHCTAVVVKKNSYHQDLYILPKAGVAGRYWDVFQSGDTVITFDIPD